MFLFHFSLSRAAAGDSRPIETHQYSRKSVPVIKTDLLNFLLSSISSHFFASLRYSCCEEDFLSPPTGFVCPFDIICDLNRAEVKKVCWWINSRQSLRISAADSQKALIPLTSFCVWIMWRRRCYSCLYFCCAESPKRSPKISLCWWKIVSFSLTLHGIELPLKQASRDDDFLKLLQILQSSGDWSNLKERFIKRSPHHHLYSK